MNLKIREHKKEDLEEMIAIWNKVVEDGVAFPQEELLNLETGETFFNEQTYTGVAVDDTGEILGLYILHPNNIGRVGHIGNASYAVRSDLRNQHIGEKLVIDSLNQAKNHGFKIIQFNAVVKSNESARHLYKKLGFKELGCIPNGFYMKNGEYEDIYLYYYDLTKLPE